MTDLQKLREYAEKATRGPWGADHNGDKRNFEEWYGATILGRFEPHGDGRVLTARNLAEVHDNPSDAEFIAAANPTVVLALLDRLEAAERERDRAMEGVADQRRGIARKMEDIAALEVEVIDLTARAEAAEAKIAAVDEIVAPIIESAGAMIGTHTLDGSCARRHVECLAVAVRAALQESEGE